MIDAYIHPMEGDTRVLKRVPEKKIVLRWRGRSLYFCFVFFSFPFFFFVARVSSWLCEVKNG